MNFDKESKSWNFFFIFLGGGGGGGGGGLRERGVAGGVRGSTLTQEPPYHIFFYTRHIGMTYSTEPYSLMKIFPSVFKIEGIVALTIKGR